MLESSDVSSGHRDEAILGLDNVALELPIAHVGSRILAAFADYLLLGFTLILGLVVFLLTSPGFSLFDEDVGLWAFAVAILVLVALHWMYFIFFEIVMDGASPGKRLAGIRVVSRDGGKVGNGAIVLRSLVREVDIMVGVLFMALDPLARRVGDRLGGTLVVHDKVAETTALGDLPRGWGAREASVVEALLARRDELAPERAEQLAARLVRLIEHGDPQFLHRHSFPLGTSAVTMLALVFEAPPAGRD
jgi:uncharacterized RDD family membrane protein YckC